MVGRYQPDHPWANLNNTLKEIKKLQSDKRYRNARRAFFIEGVRNFVQIADHGFDIVAIVYSEKLLTDPLARKLVRRSRRAGIPTLRVNPETFRKYSLTRRASGISAVVCQRWTPLKHIHLGKGICWVILGLVRSPGNLGTLIRTSEAVGGQGFILLDRSVDVYSPATVRASMGAHFRQRFIRTDFHSLQQWLVTNKGYVIGASPDGAYDFHCIAYPKPTFLFLGEEHLGLSPEQRLVCDHLVRIPMVGQVDSLNLGVAGSLMMYEIFRYRNHSQLSHE